MKKNVVKVLALLVLVFLVSLSFVSLSEANFTIKGKYAVVGHDECVGHWLSDPSFKWTKSGYLQGTMTFRINGTGVAYGTLLSLTQPGGSIGTANQAFSFQYSIDSLTKLITITFTGSGTFTSGPFSGMWFETTPYTMTGYVSSDLRTIMLSSYIDSDPQPEDFTTNINFYLDTDPSGIQQDVCQRMRNLTLVTTRQDSQ